MTIRRVSLMRLGDTEEIRLVFYNQQNIRCEAKLTQKQFAVLAQDVINVTQWLVGSRQCAEREKASRDATREP